jgi:hypothetical protein
MSCGVAPSRTDVSEELIATIIKGTRIVLRSVRQLLFTANVLTSSPSLVTLLMKAIRTSETRLLQEPQGVTSQKTESFIVTAARTSNHTWLCFK